MRWINTCITCGRSLDNKKYVTRKYLGETYYFDKEACARVFDGTGSIFECVERDNKTSSEQVSGRIKFV